MFNKFVTSTCDTLKLSFSLGFIDNLMEWEGEMYYAQLNEDGTASENKEDYQEVNWETIHPDNLFFVIRQRELLKKQIASSTSNY